MSNNNVEVTQGMWEIVKDLPPPSLNNSRKIILEKLIKFKNNPCERTAKVLEFFNIPVDYDRLDNGF